MERGSNYDQMKERARKLFLTYSQEEMIGKFRLEHTDDALYLRFAGERYQVGRKDGVVRRLDTARQEEASFEASLSIYDMLCHSAGRTPVLSGEWVPVNSLMNVKGSRGHVGLLGKYAAMIEGQTGRLSLFCEQLGGSRGRGKEDIGYVIPVFDFFPVYLQFWESDEDFPAQLQFMLDKQAADFVYYETMWYMIMHLCGKLEKTMKA